MFSKIEEKQKAIALRKEGKTYSEILEVIPVAKSTLSLWLREVGIATPQKQFFSEKKKQAQKRGAMARRTQRIEKYNFLFQTARKDIKAISKRELFLIGAVMYWAEGSKEKDFSPGSQLIFANMDTRMIQVFLRWLIEIAEIPTEMLRFEIYLHTTHQYRISDVKKYWSKHTGFPEDSFSRVYFKKTPIKGTNRKNTSPESYFGILRIGVRESSSYVRKLAGWAQGIYDAMA